MAMDQLSEKKKTGDGNVRNSPAIAVVRPIPLVPHIFQLNIDGFHEVFDFLSLKDLLALSRTCIFIHKAIGEFFRYSYGGADVAYILGGIFVKGEQPFQINGLDEYIRNVHIYDNDDATFPFIASKCKALTQIRFTHSVALTPAKVEIIKHTLRQIESIQMICVDVNESFRLFLKCCTNLKRLALRDFNPESVIIGTDNEWLRRKFPTLVHLELDLPNGNSIDELKIFFEQNPNVRSFSTNLEFLWKNRSFIEASEVKLDDLAIVGQMNDNVCALLNDFHRQGIFKKLHLYNTSATQVYVDLIATLEGLEKLFIGSNNRRLNLMDLSSLKELALYTAQTVYAPALARSLVGLKRLYISQATANDILPFIQHSVQLKKIKIPIYHGTVQADAWNQERNKLFGASKVAVFVPESVYLTNKLTAKKPNFDMVQIRRAESYDWQHHFYYK